MEEKKVEKKEEKPKRRGICGECRIGIGYPLCALCAVGAALIAYSVLK